SVNAADLRVRVFERGGNVPLPGVAVCLGTHARLDQFGASLTDDKGYVLFSEVPRAKLLVTASMPGYMSEQESMVTSTSNRMLVLSLAGGGGGPQCQITTTGTVESASGLAIRRYAINNGAREADARTVRLHNSLNGTATHYRASEQRDFAGAEWQAYSAAPEFKLSPGSGLKRVYLQVRRHSTVNGATLETLSPTVQDTIRVR
ncbi:MAG: hypothetical protein R3308_02745, partial [Thiohalobacterales bacterium]|nr:hypothetical protein [Thiohalobacterales bacterium]